MMKKNLVMKRGVLFGLIGMSMATMLTISGCVGGSLNSKSSGDLAASITATTTKTATALIQPAELKKWYGQGKVNQPNSTDRVVVLEVNTDTSRYDSGHISGAQSVGLNSDISQTRVEGPMLTGAMVPDGAKMDALIKRLGIDTNTTIVFTTSAAEKGVPWNLTRGYAVFRYWGFPKERLKVLDGGNAAWIAAGYPVTTDKPAIKHSSYSVTPNAINRTRTDLRASLTDMITAVTANSATADFIDGRTTDTPATGGTTDLIDTSKYVVFEGKIKNGRNKSHALLHVNGDFKSIAEVKSALAIPATAKSVYALCRAGNIASILFFAIDGYAYYNEVESGGLKAVWYDGSWGQWGLLSSSSGNGGRLAPGSAWDTTPLTDSFVYNVGTKKKIAGVDTVLTTSHIISYADRLSNPEPAFAKGNQLEEADAAYRGM
jgi:3-mercaptopyruvate sulfurtransferase SseA